MNMSKFKLRDRVKLDTIGEVVEIEVSEKGNCLYAVRFDNSGFSFWFNGKELKKVETEAAEKPMRANEDLEEENRKLKKENDKLTEYIRKLLEKL